MSNSISNLVVPVYTYPDIFCKYVIQTALHTHLGFHNESIQFHYIHLMELDNCQVFEVFRYDDLLILCLVEHNIKLF